MNLLLLEPHEVQPPIILRGRRAIHIIEVLQCVRGDTLTVGVLDGPTGTAQVLQVTEDTVALELIDLVSTPPPTLPVTLILALPRPRMLQRTLQTIATMGVPRLCLLQTSRVEKSYWQTPLLHENAVREQLVTGLEQGKATQLPQVTYHKRFRPFVEDELPELTASAQRLIVAHPGPFPAATADPSASTVLVVGPEGGLLEKEVGTLAAQGFSPVQLGARILRVETAIPVLLAKLF